MIKEDLKIIIIGGGVAGLSAGCYGQMNGYNTQIFEMNANPGGCCTAWDRKGFKIDTCIHWLIGARPPSPYFKLWQEVGAIQGKTMIDHDIYVSVETKDGKTFKIYNDLERLAKHMLEHAPEDKELINEFIQAIRKCQKFPMAVEKPFDLYKFFDIVKTIFRMLPYSGFFKKWSQLTLRDFSSKFRNPFLREIFSEALLPAFGDNPDLPMFQIFLTFALMSQKTVCYPLGGSLEFAHSIEERYKVLGGKIHYNSEVKEIIVENDKATGIRLSNGSEYLGDIIISAIDGYQTIYEMLDGKYVDDNIEYNYKNLPLVTSLVQVALGVDYKFENLPYSVAGYIISLDKPVVIRGQELKYLLYQIYNFDPSLSPPGKSIIKVIIGSDYKDWIALRDDKEEYRKIKDNVAQTVIEQLDKRYPGLRSKIEMIDVATPLTFKRFTGNREGSYMGWLVTPESFSVQKNKRLPGLGNFYMAGQWVESGGGLPTVLQSGRNIIQIICADNEKKFTTSILE